MHHQILVVQLTVFLYYGIHLDDERGSTETAIVGTVRIKLE